MNTYRISAIILVIFGILLGYFVYASESASNPLVWHKPFKLGLDLSGGTHLVYNADASGISQSEVGEAMSALKDVIERRINVFGVSEPIIQVSQVGLGESAVHQLIVQLPGVTNVKEALKTINQTPILEFKVERPAGAEKDLLTKQFEAAKAKLTASTTIEEANVIFAGIKDPNFIDSGLTGKYLQKAQVSFSQSQTSINGSPLVLVEFNKEGSALFAKLTKENVGKTIGIFLDGQLISAPTVQEEIRDGKAQISGTFTIDEAKELVRNLNLGALPVPISLDSTQTIGPSLGADVLHQGVYAGLIGLLILAIFMLIWYRLPGLISVFSLAMYIAIMLAIFKLLPVTLTSAGIAGFILSIGIAVDANVLIFERLKEEMRGDKSLPEAIKEGFSRAWLSIRDSNLSGIISAIILFWFGTSLIKGFALTLFIGIAVSMFTAITVTRTLLLALGVKHKNKVSTFLFSSGFKK